MPDVDFLTSCAVVLPGTPTVTARTPTSTHNDPNPVVFVFNIPFLILMLSLGNEACALLKPGVIQFPVSIGSCETLVGAGVVEGQFAIVIPRLWVRSRF